MKNNYISKIQCVSKFLFASLMLILSCNAAAQTITTPGTFSFVVPAGITRLTIECWGAGGAGGASGSNGGSGGGGGAYATRIYAVVPGQVITYTVGAGGTSAVGANGTNGGQSYVTSSVGGFISMTALGGTGGKRNKGTAGTGGTASGGTTNTNGGNGTVGGTWGERGGNGANGGTGGARVQNSTGNAGNAPGGGGSGGERYWGTDYAGGNGANGQVTFTWAPTIVVGYKSGTVTDNDFGIDGLIRTYTTAKLLNPANFGGSGAPSPFSFVMYDFGTNPITEASLIANGIQILDLGTNNSDAGSGTDITSYSTAEITEIKKWTISSNKRVVLAFQGFANALGDNPYTAIGTGNTNPNSLTPTGQNILSGPFGTTNSFNQGGTYQGTFSDFPRESSCILAQDLNGNPTGLVNNITGDIYLADVGLVSHPDPNDPNLMSETADINTNGDRLLANLYHGMARIVQYGPQLVCDFFSCYAGINPPSLNATSINIVCPATTVNLSSLFTGTVPENSVLRWYDNSIHSGSPVADPTQAPAGIYYAFFVDPVGGCFSPASLPILVEPGISITSTSLTGFSYIVGNGPSAAQTFYVTGSCLNDGITVTPPTNYEIWNGTSYQTSPIIIPHSGGNVNSTAVQIRLIAGLAVGDYPATLTLSSPGATSKFVALSGTVTNAYCTSSGGNNSSIMLVRFNTINNASARPSGYSDYTATQITNVIAGSPYYLTVNLNTAGNNTEYCTVWIDWNRNGVFTDAGESYSLGSTNNSTNGQTSSSPLQIAVPIGASVGATRMRVSCSASSTIPSCGNITTGEVEDYTVNITKNYWRGNLSPNWGTSDNWTAGYVPTDGDDVVYSTGTPYSVAVRDLILDTDRTIGNLTNATTKNLEIPAGKGLRVNGTITTDNNPDRILIKSAVSTPNGSLIFPNASNVNATVEMYSKAYKEPTPITINGVNYSYNWQFFGIPVRSITAQPTFDGSYVREYKQDKQGLYTKWDQLNNASVLKPFKGYEITQEATKTLSFKGVLVKNDTTISLPITNDPLVYFRGQHLLSNPYTAAIDVRQLEFGANTEQTVYLYNTGSFGAWVNSGGGTAYDDNSSTAGQYIAIPQRPAGFSDGLPNDIPSMSGFLVKATDSTSYSPGSITIRYNSLMITNNVNSQRVKANTNDNTNDIINTDLISTKIDLTGLHYSDRMWIFTEPSCSKNFDNGWDGRKMLGSSLAPQIYAIEPDGDYQVNSVNDMNNTDIAFQPGDEVEYTLKFTHDNVKSIYAGVYLADLIENKTIDITESGTTYKFATAPASEPSKRFKIIARHYEKAAPDAESKVKIFSARSSVFVQNLSTDSGECTLYDILGRAIIKRTYGPNSITELGGNLTLGAYITTTITNGEKVSKRVIVQ